MPISITDVEKFGLIFRSCFLISFKRDQRDKIAGHAAVEKFMHEDTKNGYRSVVTPFSSFFRTFYFATLCQAKRDLWGWLCWKKDGQRLFNWNAVCSTIFCFAYSTTPSLDHLLPLCIFYVRKVSYSGCRMWLWELSRKSSIARAEERTWEIK